MFLSSFKQSKQFLCFSTLVWVTVNWDYVYGRTIVPRSQSMHSCMSCMECMRCTCKFRHMKMVALNWGLNISCTWARYVVCMSYACTLHILHWFFVCCTSCANCSELHWQWSSDLKQQSWITTRDTWSWAGRRWKQLLVLANSPLSCTELLSELKIKRDNIKGCFTYDVYPKFLFWNVVGSEAGG